MRVLIVDDHPIAQIGLSAVVEDALPVEQIDFADTSTAALKRAGEREPDIILMDMHLPDSLPPRELCEQLLAMRPQCKIVLVTASGSAGDIRDCLQAGALGCLLKDTSEGDMTLALRSVAAGRAFIDPRIAQDIVVELATGRQAARNVRLTARERDVLRCLADGRSNRQIAAQLILTESTVKGYVSNLLEKLGAASRLEAVVRAGEAGLL
jgi:two-component system nitrate/nitrite response regulator NarL